jgi:hypothetical protein
MMLDFTSNLPEPSHRGLTALKQVHHPTQGDHRPGEHRQVHAEGDESADGDGAVDRERSAGAKHDHGSQSAEEREEWIESAPQPDQRHVESQVLVVEGAKPLYLGRFLPVGADDPRTGQVLLRVGGQRREMLLHRFEPVMNGFAHFDGENRQEERRQQRQQRKLDIDSQHEIQREQASENRIGQIHHGGADGHPDGAKVVCEPRHDVAGAGLCKIGGVERL